MSCSMLDDQIGTSVSPAGCADGGQEGPTARRNRPTGSSFLRVVAGMRYLGDGVGVGEGTGAAVLWVDDGCWISMR